MNGNSEQRGWYAEFQNAMRELPQLSYAQNMSIGDVWGKKHWSVRHEIIHVRHGRARIDIGARTLEVGPDDTALIAKGQSHSDLRMSPGDYQVLMIEFKWDRGEKLLRQLDVRRLLNIPEQAKLHLRLLCHEVEREALQDVSDAQQRASVALVELLAACIRYCQPFPKRMTEASRRVASHRLGQQIEGVRQYLHEHYNEPIALDQLAQMYEMNAFYLSRAFTRELGISITDMLVSLRMEKARDLLETRQLSIKEVAYKVGYASGNYFSKVFRRYYGLSPSEFQAKGCPQDEFAPGRQLHTPFGK